MEGPDVTSVYSETTAGEDGRVKPFSQLDTTKPFPGWLVRLWKEEGEGTQRLLDDVVWYETSERRILSAINANGRRKQRPEIHTLHDSAEK